ncbi:hypothetical protein JHK82_049637 [Glycine max]|nr:hypothetical protein JHK82_049637 [Glycine max]
MQDGLICKAVREVNLRSTLLTRCDPLRHKFRTTRQTIGIGGRRVDLSGRWRGSHGRNPEERYFCMVMRINIDYNGCYRKVKRALLDMPG